MGIKDFFQGNKKDRQERRSSYIKEETDRYLPDGGREVAKVKVNRFKNQTSKRVNYDDGYTFTGDTKESYKKINYNVV